MFGSQPVSAFDVDIFSKTRLRQEANQYMRCYQVAEQEVQRLNAAYKADSSSEARKRLCSKQAELAFYSLESEFLENFIRLQKIPANKGIFPGVIGGVCAKWYFSQLAGEYYQQKFSHNVLLGDAIREAFRKRIKFFTSLFKITNMLDCSFETNNFSFLSSILKYINQGEDDDLLPRSLISAATAELTELSELLVKMTARSRVMQNIRRVCWEEGVDSDDELSPVPSESKDDASEFKRILRQLRVKEKELHNTMKEFNAETDTTHTRFLDKVAEAYKQSDKPSAYFSYLKNIIVLLICVSDQAGADGLSLKVDILAMCEQSVHKDLVSEVLGEIDIKLDENPDSLLGPLLFSHNISNASLKQESKTSPDELLRENSRVESSNSWWSLFCCCLPKEKTGKLYNPVEHHSPSPGNS